MSFFASLKTPQRGIKFTPAIAISDKYKPVHATNRKNRLETPINCAKIANDGTLDQNKVK